MICPNCQRPLREGAQFCTTCGTRTAHGRDSLADSIPTVDHAATGGETMVESDPLVGRVLDGKYEIGSRLGEGGMGAVYRARRVHIGDEVAVKVLHTKFVNDETLVERFRREARAAAQLQHPNVVTIHDYGESRGQGGFAYIVMELVRGISLRDLLKREGKLDVRRAVSLMRDICAGVGAAHRHGIVHRDIKPDNIIVIPAGDDDEAERVKVVDFGIAKLRDMTTEGTLTQAGTMVGTPFYMSPEQCKGEQLDARADVYSLGALLYEMLAGTPPFTAPTLTGVILKHINEPPPPMAQDLRVPAPLQSGIARALAKDPAGRQRDATEFAREIQAAAAAPATTANELQATAPAFPATTQPTPVAPLPTTTAQTSAPAQTHPQGFAQQTYPPQPSQTYPPKPSPPHTFDVPPRKSRVPLVIGVLVVLLAGLGLLAVFGVIYFGGGKQQVAVNVNVRPTATPAPSVTNANAANANAAATPTVAASEPMQRAEQKLIADTLLTRDDLAALSPAQLRVLRNAVFARYGRTFQAADLQQYFQSRPWYRPRADFSEKMLTANDHANADLIKAFEAGNTAAPADAATLRKEVGAALEGWAASTRARDLDAHMSFYADTLDPYYLKRNAPASQVRADRARAFTHYDEMDVRLSNLQITPDATGTNATVTFDKTWDFDADDKHSTGSVRQQLTLTKSGGRWLITSERDLQVHFTNSEEY
jgi:serine/threonine-protein kinase